MYIHITVARKIVEAHSGSINVMSEGETGHGSTFYVDVPVLRILDDQHSVTASGSSQTSHSAVSARLVAGELTDLLPDDNPLTHVLPVEPPHFSSVAMRAIQSLLIVDDSPTNRKMMRRLLRDKCDLIDEASDGRDAIQQVNDFLARRGLHYDVIMMDFVMPVMNGPDCVRELRRQGFPGLIIGVTGNSLESDIAVFLAAGVNKVMIKPLDAAKFMTYALGEASDFFGPPCCVYLHRLL
jgi:CheY-like chemotaxis protein